MNIFQLTGQLIECRIDLFPQFVKCKMFIRTNEQTLSCYYHVNKKFHKDEYDNFLQLISSLSPKCDGWVYVNKKKYYKLNGNDSPTRLFITGNLYPRNNYVFFNAECVRLSDVEIDELSIRLDGVQVDNKRLLNIVYDNPRVFNITGVPSCQINEYQIEYDCGYIIKDKIVTKTNKPTLNVVGIKKTDKYIEDKQIKNYLLEWEIMNEGD